jgi:hypothetical protein
MFALYFILLFLPAFSFGGNNASSEKNISHNNIKDPAGEFLSEQRFNAERRKTNFDPHNCFEKTASLHMLARRQTTLAK